MQGRLFNDPGSLAALHLSQTAFVSNTGAELADVNDPSSEVYHRIYMALVVSTYSSSLI